MQSCSIVCSSLSTLLRCSSPNVSTSQRSFPNFCSIPPIQRLTAITAFFGRLPAKHPAPAPHDDGFMHPFPTMAWMPFDDDNGDDDGGNGRNIIASHHAMHSLLNHQFKNHRTVTWLGTEHWQCKLGFDFCIDSALPNRISSQLHNIPMNYIGHL